MKTEKDVQDYQEYVISMRRQIHMNPEPGFEEFETTKLIIQELHALGFEVFENVNKTGAIGILHGSIGKTIALRADIDALRMQEHNDVEYKSKKDGLMHACGHDAHTAMLLGACKYFSDHKSELNGTLKVIFQPAEEGPLPGGALGIVKKGLIDDVDAIFGIHITTTYPSGKIAIKSGSAMASPDKFQITINGVGTHASAPETGWDSILTSAQIINALQSIVSRNIDPNHLAVVSVGTIHGGTTFNVIPDQVSFSGTIRTFDSPVRTLIHDRITSIVEHTCKMNHCTYSINIEEGYPPLINNEEMTNLVIEVGKKTLGDENVLVEQKPSMGGEDFSYYLQKVPGAFYWLGAQPANQKEVYYNHNPKFDIDESVLIKGSLLHINTVLNYLK